MLTRLTSDGQLTWRCIILDEDGDLVSCGEEKTAQLDEILYQDCPLIDEPGKGAVIALPQCSCGAHTFLKADYTLKELWRACLTVVNDSGVIWAYALPLRYVHNLRAHWMLYEQGQAVVPPVVPLPPDGLAQATQIDNSDVVHALWFGYCVARERLGALEAGDKHLAIATPHQEFYRQLQIGGKGRN